MTKLYTDQGLIQHTAKIKAGLAKAKKAGKKLGRPKGDKIKGEDEVMRYYRFRSMVTNSKSNGRFTMKEIAEYTGVSLSTVQKIINKYKNK